MGAHPEPGLDDGTVEGRQGGIDQEGGVGQARLLDRVRGGEEGREIGLANELDPVEETLGVIERLAGPRRIDGEDDEVHRHPIPFRQLGQGNQQIGTNGAEAEKNDPQRWQVMLHQGRGGTHGLGRLGQER